MSHGTIFITNDQPSEIKLRLEPWAEEHLIPAGQRIAVTFDSPPNLRVDIVIQGGVIVLGGFPGQVLDVKPAT